MAIDWSRLRDIVEPHDRFLITSHVRPDGDALGSELGMAELLIQKGKYCRIVNASSLPARYKFLDLAGRVRQLGVDVDESDPADFDVVMILDTSAWSQLGGMADLVRTTMAKKVVIDHHIGHDEMGAELFKDSTAAACGLLIAEATVHLGGLLTREIAEPLFVALATDTGWFRFSSTDGRTLRVAAQLVETGLEVNRLYRLLFEESSVARLKLTGRMLESLRVTCDGRVAYSSIRQGDLRATGASYQDSEDMVNYTLSIAGVEVGLLFVELQSGGLKVSFRSRGEFDCTKVAAQFGGGGHRQAAGATFEADPAEAEARVLKAVASALLPPSSS